jgi:aconitate hydratase
LGEFDADGLLSAREPFELSGGEEALIHSLPELGRNLDVDMQRLPFSIRILVENVLRRCDGAAVTADDVVAAASWSASADRSAASIPFVPSRVLHTDATGIPALIDLAAMRDELHRLGLDPELIQPVIPCDLIIDHSIQAGAFGSPDALAINSRMEFERNRERLVFLKWAQSTFRDFRVAPPGVGIVHQVNLERLASVVVARSRPDGVTEVFPDTLLGTDSHTTMINGLGVVGWGVGGLEAEAVMLGQPYLLPTPDVVGCRIDGEMPSGSSATDLVLALTQMLRAHDLVDRIVEFFGPGVKRLSVPDRATIANMAPEYGATMGFFPSDARTLDYLRATDRSPASIDIAARYLEKQGLLADGGGDEVSYSMVLHLDLSTIEPSVAGPFRPQDRQPLRAVSSDYSRRVARRAVAHPAGRDGGAVRDGDVVVAAITSCTSTSNPSLMVAAGLIARNAVSAGLQVRPWVKTTFAPGSRVVTDYLRRAHLLEPMEALGFHVVAYGCTTCIGNSGDLADEVMEQIEDADLDLVAVLSGNRNFQGRTTRFTKYNYLASPALVIAYALAGRIDVDLTTSPLAQRADGADVHLADLWPTTEEIEAVVDRVVVPHDFRSRYASAFTGDEQWAALAHPSGPRYEWDPSSTYFQRPPFLDGFRREAPPSTAMITDARALAVLGDSVTTDDIIPAGGTIAPGSPAGAWLIERGVPPTALNSFTARRGAHDVQIRGVLSNAYLPNHLSSDVPPGMTVHLPTGHASHYFAIAEMYAANNTPVVIFGGERYGTGSSRDWAAKGVALLGVRAVIAKSFERIHRNNLIGTGVLPLEFLPGESLESFGLTGQETFSFLHDGALRPGAVFRARATSDGEADGREFRLRCRLDTPQEVHFFRHGGIVPAILRQVIEAEASRSV